MSVPDLGMVFWRGLYAACHDVSHGDGAHSVSPCTHQLRHVGRPLCETCRPAGPLESAHTRIRARGVARLYPFLWSAGVSQQP